MDPLTRRSELNKGGADNPNFPVEFFIRSFGVLVHVETNSPDALEAIRALLPSILVDHYDETEKFKEAHRFTYEWNNDGLDSLYENGEWVSILRDRKELLNILGTRIRLTVAEFAQDRIFVHAGVVAVDGRAIIIPGTSHSGKTTLVAELVRRGVVYFSDEYAVLDANGLVYPFAKPLSMRSDGSSDQTDIAIEALGGKSGTSPVPVGLILFTKFNANAVWKPKRMNPAKAILELIRDTIPIRRDPQFTMSVLNSVVENAILVESKRNEAADAASKIINLLKNPNVKTQ